ncbi:hypothetical protein BI350_06715 [Sporosarcina ureilytica]|uniref:GGDEF domain-containing protein n=1 Tax=Sporosarcina ureilytica TaxID=298596 RepID=A0A1D8JEX2_9BACL|nr:hypothetical protein BI350_06715 [Sporosarcina ureilytica]
MGKLNGIQKRGRKKHVNRYHSLYLTVVLICFSLFISIAIASFDYRKVQDQLRLNHENEIDMIGDTVVQSLHTIDQVYKITDETTANKMEENTAILLEHYEQNPFFGEWDFAQLKKQFGMDIFIIDDNNIVIHSSFEQDLGLDFDECCGSFGKRLHERRISGDFYHDGMDIHQATGEIKKFSYMATPDRKYLLELSASLENDNIFNRFNFLETIAQLEKDYAPIHSIHVYSPNGIILGYTDKDGKSKEVLDDMRPVFLEARRTGEPKEAVRTEEQGIVTYRYIPYVADADQELPMRRIVEIVYNEAELEGLLKFYRDEFIYQQLIIVIAVILLAIIIGRLIAKPIHLALHDSLTGLKNRAAFEMEIRKRLSRKHEHVALMMIDMDNFKQVNDRLGHAEGDRILVETAKIIQKVVGDKNVVARIGGDEFVVVYSNVTREEQTKIASSLIQKLNEVYKELNEQLHAEVSISIGIAYATNNEQLETLYNRADKALYCAKENGKNQYRYYETTMNAY